MRYNTGDFIKYKQKDGKLFVGKITFNNSENDPASIIEVETYGVRFIVYKDSVLQNITEETEDENKNSGLSESLAIISKCDRCSNNVIITCAQKSNEERLREENERLKKELKEKQEESLSGFHVKYTLNKPKNSGDDYKDLIIKSLEDLLRAQVEENKLLRQKLNQIAGLADCDSKYNVKENIIKF